MTIGRPAHHPPSTDTSLVIGVLALQGDVREHMRALESCGVSTLAVRRPEELEASDALVIPGGESTTMSKLAVNFGLLKPLRKRVEAGMPAYGSCAGMIMLADRIADGTSDQETIGGIDMLVRRNAFGRQVHSFEADVHLAGIGGDPYHAVFIRAPWVEAAGEEVEVLGRVEAAGDSAGVLLGRVEAAGDSAGDLLGRVEAAGDSAGVLLGRVEAAGDSAGVLLGRTESGDSAGRIVAVRQGRLLATAFHPELTGDHRVHRFFTELVRRAMNQEA